MGKRTFDLTVWRQNPENRFETIGTDLYTDLVSLNYVSNEGLIRDPSLEFIKAPYLTVHKAYNDTMLPDGYIDVRHAAFEVRISDDEEEDEIVPFDISSLP